MLIISASRYSHWPLLTLRFFKRYWCYFRCRKSWVFQPLWLLWHVHSLSLSVQPSQSRWKHQRDLQSPCPEELIRNADPVLSRPPLLRPTAEQQEEKPTLKSVVRSSTSWARDTLTRTSRKHLWLHRTISKWPRISCVSLSPFPPLLTFLHSTLPVPLFRVRSLALSLAQPGWVWVWHRPAQSSQSPSPAALPLVLADALHPCGF